MKTQHLKFEILKERLCLFYYNINFVLNMLSIGKLCKEKKIIRLVMSGVTSQEVSMFAKGKVVNQMQQNLG